MGKDEKSSYPVLVDQPSDMDEQISVTKALPTTINFGDLEDCPPSDCSYGPKILYRLVLADPPSARDFLTYEESGQRREGDPCLRRALSTHATAAEADRIRKNVNYFSRHMIAEGDVPATAGPMKRTGASSGHWSWWPLVGIVRQSYFVVIT